MAITFSATTTGVPKLRAKFRAINAVIIGAMGKHTIEKFLLARTKSRFLPAGSSDNAQKSPDGTKWAPPSPTTLKRKSRIAGATVNPTQALVSGRALVNSIRVLSRDVASSSINSPTGGFFSIGISKSSPAYKYARIQQSGGSTPRGGYIPPRVFIGVGAVDTAAITTYLRKTLRKGVVA